MFVERFPGSLQQQSVAGSQNSLVRSLILASPLYRKMTRSPLGVTIPGNTDWLIMPDRGGTTTSAKPELRLNSVPAISVGHLPRGRPAACLTPGWPRFRLCLVRSGRLQRQALGAELDLRHHLPGWRPS